MHLQGNTGWVCHTEESANPLHSGTLCVKAGDFHTGLVGPHSHEGFVWHNYPVADLDPGTKEATFIYEWRPYPNGSGYLREAIAPPPNTITDLYVPWPQAPCCQRISLSIERYGGDADASVGSWAFDSAHGPAMTTRPPDSSAPPPGAE